MKVNEHKESESDFQRILNSLRFETNLTEELTSNINHLSNCLKQIERDDATLDKEKTKSVEVMALLDYIWLEIYKIRKTNEELLLIKDHLQSIIGG